MKNLYSIILIAILSFLSLSIHAQIEEEEFGEFFGKEDYLKDFEEMRVQDPNCCEGETLPDFTFYYSPGSALSNHELIERAREAALDAWFDRQHDLMKKEIEKQLDKRYSNFEQARNDYLKHIEKRNIYGSSREVRRKYEPRIKAKETAKDKLIKNLKLLELREVELNLGNINNTSYGSFNFNGVPIGDIRSLSQLNTLRNQEVNTFGTNEWKLHDDRGLIKFLDRNISEMEAGNYDYPILNELLELQMEHYNNIGQGLPWHPSWYQLDLMQLYLNNVRIPILIIDQPIQATDYGSPEFLENYAIRNRRGISVFDPEYPEYIFYKVLTYGMDRDEFESEEVYLWEEAERITAERQENYIDDLLGGVSEEELLDGIGSNCESFKFSNVTANWQEAAVIGIRKSIFLISQRGIKYKFTLSYPQAVLFGMPANLHNGGPVSNGAAAEISAQVLDKAFSEIGHKYARTNASSATVDFAFREKLKKLYKTYIPGGRVQFNATNYSVIPSQYQTLLFGNGDCN